MHFQIVPTTICNAKCFYCYESNSKFETMQEDTMVATVNFIRKYMVGKKNEKIEIDWFGGEPMLVPEIIEKMAKEILLYAEENNIVINSGIVTNASKISEDSIPFLKRIGINRIQISMDGMKDEYTKRKAYVDGNNYFNHVVSCTKMLSENDIKTILRINVDRNNVVSCAELIDFLGNNLPKKVNIYVAPLYGNGDSYLSSCDIVNVLSELQNQIDLLGFERKVRKSIEANYCRTSQLRSLVIKPNGEIIHCEHMYDKKEAVIGSVYDGIINDLGWICNICHNVDICKMGCKEENKIDCEKCWKFIWKR